MNLEKTDAVLEARDLVVEYRVGSRYRPSQRKVLRAVDGVSLRIDPGETVGLVGESGSGKSTLARTILQLTTPSSGTLHFEGRPLISGNRRQTRELRRRAQMVFQNPMGSLNARMTVGRIVREPLDIHRIGDRSSRRRRVAELLDLVALPSDAERRYPHQFSGGQQQRVAIARALAAEPSLVVCDEPVAALDVSVQAQILQLLKDLQESTGVAYLFISHDLNVVRHVTRRLVIMYLGAAVEEGPSEAVFSRPRHPYTQALIAAIPEPDPEYGRPRVTLRGEIPSPSDLPSGCRFRTRCIHARARCAAEEPAMETTEDGVSVACHFWREIAQA